MAHPTSERLQLYVEQRVGEWEQQAIGDHLTACERCTLQVMSLDELVTDLESMKELSLPAEFAADVTEEAVPSDGLKVAPARRSVFVQTLICLIILATCAGLLLVVDTPVTDPSDDVVGAIDVLLGSPFQADSTILVVLAFMAMAGLGVLACVLRSSPASERQRKQPVPSRARRRH